MAFNRYKSILKEPTIDLYEDVVNDNNAGKSVNRAEKLFDNLFGVCLQTYDRKSNKRRDPLMAINANLAPNQRSLDSSDLDNDNDITCIEVNHLKDKDFEPSAKTSRTKVNKPKNKLNSNRVKFANEFDNNFNKKIKKLSKKAIDYPDCTKDALLKAFESANLPDYEEIARHELVVTKVNGNDTLRADPPTPPLYEILKPFEDLIDWSKVDMKSNESQNRVLLKQHKRDRRKTASTVSQWETTENIIDSYDDNNDVFDVDFVPINNELKPNNKESTITENNINPSTNRISDESIGDNRHNSRTSMNGKNERIRTAGLGDSRIASTPVLRRLNVTLRSHNVSPIKSIDSPEGVFDSTKSKVYNERELTFAEPLPPTNRQSRKAVKTSIPKNNIRLEVVKPLLSDNEKVTLCRDRVKEISRTLIDSKTCGSCEGIKANDEQIHTMIDRKQSRKKMTSTSSSSVPSKEGTYSLRGLKNKTSYNKNNELSSIFAPKIKSTPLMATKETSYFNSRDDSIHSKFDLFVDDSHLDVSMSALYPSKSCSRNIAFPKTTTIVRVLDFETQKHRSLNRSTPYHIYRKSIATVNSVNRTCHPCRTVVKARTIVSAHKPSAQRIAVGLNSKEDLKQYFDSSLSVAFATSKVVFDDGTEEQLTPKQKVLLLCKPNQIIDLKDAFEPHVLKNCKKIGEGSYGEVYASKDSSGNDIVIKIIALNMDDVDSEEDKFSQILPELVISNTFNHLKTSYSTNKASNFIEMMRATCAKGSFPKKLIDEWDLYAKHKLSENEDPRIYGTNQFYIILHLSNGGTDLESFKFNRGEEALSMFSQLALSLAAAEAEYQFEHRDLHWGNVLITHTDDQLLEYIVNGNKYTLRSKGVFASIIDFSLSRLSKDGFVIYDDLSKYSDLFEGQGDYQFDVYRLMKDSNQNNWQTFCPKSNIFWLHYLTDKLLNSKKYSSRAKLHRSALKSLQTFSNNILLFESAQHFVESHLFKQFLSEF